MLKKYLHYLKRSNKEIQKFHIALISGFFTGLFAFIYLTFMYDTTNIPIFKKINSNFVKQENYKRPNDEDMMYVVDEVKQSQNQIEVDNNFEKSSESPVEIFFNIWNETKSKLSDSSDSLENLKSLFSNQNSYQAK